MFQIGFEKRSSMYSLGRSVQHTKDVYKYLAAIPKKYINRLEKSYELGKLREMGPKTRRLAKGLPATAAEEHTIAEQRGKHAPLKALVIPALAGLLGYEGTKKLTEKKAYDESSDPLLNTFFKPEKKKATFELKLDTRADAQDNSVGMPRMFNTNDSAVDVFTGYGQT